MRSPLRRKALAASRADLATRNILLSINWNFSTPFTVGRSDSGLFDARKHHWYPATFIPEIPCTLIEVLSSPNANVYDPFTGIGTTTFQALQLGRVPFGSEICLVAVEFIHSIFRLLSPSADLDTALVQIERILGDFSGRQNEKDVPDSIRIEELRCWYNPETFKRLLYLFVEERRCRNRTCRAALRIAISATLKAVCAQDKGWGCIADNVLPSAEQLSVVRDPISRVRRNVSVLMRDIRLFRDGFPEKSKELLATTDPSAFVVHGDMRSSQAIPDSTANLIVTSPPYPNMTDYATSQRLSYYWLGADPAQDLHAEIGARRKRFASSAIDQYKEAMKSVSAVLHRKLVRKGHACLVLPSFNTDHANNVCRRSAIQEVLRDVGEAGLVLEQELERILPDRRRHHNQDWTSLEREKIYIFRKP